VKAPARVPRTIPSRSIRLERPDHRGVPRDTGRAEYAQGQSHRAPGRSVPARPWPSAPATAGTSAGHHRDARDETCPDRALDHLQAVGIGLARVLAHAMERGLLVPLVELRQAAHRSIIADLGLYAGLYVGNPLEQRLDYLQASRTQDLMRNSQPYRQPRHHRRCGLRILYDQFERLLVLCGLTEEQVLAMAEREHLPEIAATALAQYLLKLEHGMEKIRDTFGRIEIPHPSFGRNRDTKCGIVQGGPGRMWR
jgi:hypothetical protein